ncbi:haloalkane dehalogenase [Pseudonocardia sp. MH-G8]|uniref:haloalkane dehalogenase n=1 Tax=Pseudonocardia sp. MH-G8 TaxID=1854588 RepID=UPI000BA05004|nr:haloalkane dehalogenase [Pseudonocardia sp. MH-G8]OZM81898.1 haloalkane dehalogenase [Pseudonocardia sp. MH-G8]
MPVIPVLDSTIHHTETGSGATFVFLHGNPASSHMWRGVLPHVGPGRLLAPDLIGMGRSGKPDIPYLFADHTRYLDAWFDALELHDVVLVGHDWGGALACDWASRHPERVRGLALFEAIIKPIDLDTLTPQARARADMVRTRGEELLESDQLIRMAYTGGVRTPVTDETLADYLAPFPTPRTRRPVLAWAQQIPLGGEPAEIVARVEVYDAWLAKSTDVPKLLLTFDGSPTLMIDPDLAAWCAENIAGLDIVACGEAGHHAAEDRPREIAAAVATWADENGLR